MPRYLTDLADILRDAGLTVVEIPGWKTRAATMGGKPGPFDPVGILCHHTAGTGDGYGYANWMATTGYPPTLYPPLAQLGLGRDGTWYVQAAGRANHAGRCRPIAGLKTLPGQSYGDGNTQLLGIEAMNTGSEGWSATQYGSYVRGVAALKRAYGWDIVLGHKETSIEGKVDPDFSMNQFRDDVAANPQEDDMPTPKEIAEAVWLTDGVIPSPDASSKDNPEWGGATYLRNIANNIHAMRDLLKVASRDAAVARSLAEKQAEQGGPLSPEEVAEATRQGVARALSEAAQIEVRVKAETPEVQP